MQAVFGASVVGTSESRARLDCASFVCLKSGKLVEKRKDYVCYVCRDEHFLRVVKLQFAQQYGNCSLPSNMVIEDERTRNECFVQGPICHPGSYWHVTAAKGP